MWMPSCSQLWLGDTGWREWKESFMAEVVFGFIVVVVYILYKLGLALPKQSSYVSVHPDTHPAKITGMYLPCKREMAGREP